MKASFIVESCSSPGATKADEKHWGPEGGMQE